jgi:hypothetical protein
MIIEINFDVKHYFMIPNKSLHINLKRCNITVIFILGTIMMFLKEHWLGRCDDKRLVGENGKTADVMTAWIDDIQTGEMRLTSAYVKKRKDGKHD